MGRTTSTASVFCRFATLALLLFVSAPMAWAADWKLPLPRRAFLVEGGHVALQGGVCRNTELEPVLFGKLRYPIKYFVILRNETFAPIYADVQWRVPDTREMTLKSDGIAPGGFYSAWRIGFGVKNGEPIPFTVTVYSDRERTRQVGIERGALFFEEADRKAFLENFNEPHSVPLISGWREMKHPRANIPGTASSGQLQRDIQLELWQRESIPHRDCGHEVIAVGVARPEENMWLSDASEDLQRRVDALQKKDAIRFEDWQVQSCEATTTYHLAMTRSPRAGTDFLVTSGGEKGDPTALPGLLAQAESIAGMTTPPTSSAAKSGTPVEGGAGAAADFFLHEDHRDQFTIELPSSWHVSDQAARSGKPGPFGVIVFSSRSMSAPIEPGADRAQLEATLLKWAEQQDSGEVPSFYVDRHPSKKGSSCAGLSEEEKTSLLKSFQTSAFGAEEVRILEPVEAEPVGVGGCRGLEVLVRAASKVGEDINLLVHTVSDGTTTYDFALRNRKGFFEKNRPMFDRAVASVRLTRAEKS